jgi:hypothetical protein
VDNVARHQGDWSSDPKFSYQNYVSFGRAFRSELKGSGFSRRGMSSIVRSGGGIVMLSNSHRYPNPANGGKRAHLESLIREDFDRCHPDDSFEEMKRRSTFIKGDKGLLRDWMALAAWRATDEQGAAPLKIATE